MKFSAQEIDFITWQLRSADWDRAQRRVKINELANGVPSFTAKQAQEMRLPVNFNDLSHTRELHNARAQFTAAFMKPGEFFSCRTDAGRKDRRDKYGRTVTKKVGKIMKRSLPYFETHRSKWAQTVLHGISPCIFQDSDCWYSRSIGIEDFLVPSNTELMDVAQGTLPFFAVYQSLKVPQLIKLAKGPSPDPGWNQSLVDACIKWADEQTMTLGGSTWSDWLSPEKWEERIKGSGGLYWNDQVPTINVWNFFWWNDDKKVSGWNRRIILDAWSMPDGPSGMRTRRTEAPFNGKDQFLYDPGDRKWASQLREIANLQYADLSAVAPFRHYTVRGLGYLLYSLCHVRNRLSCKFLASVFEQMMVLMRVRSQDDMQRALSVNLVDFGFVDESVEFLGPDQRYQVNAQLAQLGLSETQNLISRNAASYTAKIPSAGDNKVPTATQWMGEEAKVTQLVSAGLQQAYEYQKPEYYEIFRRFTRKHSTDPDVQHFQTQCLQDGVPEDVLYNLASWDIEPERVVGAGNKTLEMMVADWMVNHIQMYDPDAQRRIKQMATLAITDDAALTDVLVPEEPQISNSVHDAQLSIGTLLLAQPMALRMNVSHNEYAMALLDGLEIEISKIQSEGGVPDSNSVLLGLQNLAGITINDQPIPGNGAASHISIFGQDPANKAETKVLNDLLSKSMNEVRAFDQRFKEAQQQQNGGAQIDPEVLGKIESQRILAEAKAANTRESHAQRTSQRAIQFEMQHEQDQAAAMLDLEKQKAQAQLDLTVKAAENALEIQKKRTEATAPPSEE